MLARIAKTAVVALALAAVGAGGLLLRHPLLRGAARDATELELARLVGGRSGGRSGGR